MKKFLAVIAVMIFSATVVSLSAQEAKKIDKDQFVKLVYNYESTSENPKFLGERPCIVDFYADWCPPCRAIAPLLEEIAKDYKGKVDVYKVNIDDNKELATAYAIKSIPTLLFCPKNGKPGVIKGAVGKEKLEEAIKTYLIK